MSDGLNLAVMQPYFLPYIGYFQLMAAADKFVIYDDVNFINRGWVNRNRLLLNGSAHTFTVPLRGASQNKLIFEIELVEDSKWRQKLLRTIHQSYSKATCYSTIIDLLERLIYYPTIHLDKFLLNSIQEIAKYLHLDVDIIPTSRIYNNESLKGQDRILDICRLENASDYINPIGGIELYDKPAFESRGLKLHFLQSTLTPYAQGTQEYVPWLSIVDVLMFNKPSDLQSMLIKATLV